MLPAIRVLLASALVAASAAAATSASDVTHAGVKFRVVRVRPEQVSLVWKAADGTPYRTFDRVQAALSAQGKRATFLMNGGLFQSGGTPCGLYVESGAILHPANTADGYGNFHLKPNGVFWIGAGGATPTAHVSPTDVFLRDKPKAEYAVQSGPLLLHAGVRHPKFANGSANKLHRNGVGVDASGSVVFAMTGPGQWVNFWDFAGLFLALGCRDALFLDGDISQMAVNPAAPVHGNPFGSIFVVAE